MASEDGELFKQMREEKRQRLHDKQNWSKELLDQWCLENGVELRTIAEYQFRLFKAKMHGDIKIDIYPQSQRWHNLKNNTRGRYRELIGFVNGHFS
jgi:hypothetical protein